MEQTKSSDCTLDYGRAKQSPAWESARRKTTTEKEGCGKERRGQDAQDPQSTADMQRRRQALQGGRQENRSDGKRPGGGKRMRGSPACRLAIHPFADGPVVEPCEPVEQPLHIVVHQQGLEVLWR